MSEIYFHLLTFTYLQQAILKIELLELPRPPQVPHPGSTRRGDFKASLDPQMTLL